MNRDRTTNPADGHASRQPDVPLDLLDYMLFLPSIWVAAGLGISLRELGVGFIVLPVGTCLLYAILRRTRPPIWLTAYIVYCCAIGVCSAFRIMPASWQLYFVPEAIPRQLVPVVGFICIAWASRAYFERHPLSQPLRARAGLFLVLSLAVAPSLMALQGMRYRSDGGDYSAYVLYGAFINNTLIALFFLSTFTFLASGMRRYLAAGAIVLIAVGTPFIQFKLFAAMFLGIFLGIPSRFVSLMIILALLAAYAVGFVDIDGVMKISPDSGIRLVFIRDALRSVVDSHGLGIGYGTESVRWVYRFPDLPAFTFLPNAAHMTRGRFLEALSTGVHNSFVQALLRTGILGFFLLTAALVESFPRATLPSCVRKHACVVFGVMFIACFVNPALESPVQIVGIGFAYGYLISLRRPRLHCGGLLMRMLSPKVVPPKPRYGVVSTVLGPP